VDHVGFMDGNHKQGHRKIRAACCLPLNSIQNQRFVLSSTMLLAAIPHETVLIHVENSI
jgi:hypothetical protein